MDELKWLLYNTVIFKEKDKEIYYRVKDNIKKFKNFIVEKLGYEIIIRGDFIKLQKLPGIAESYMGIEEFVSNKEYVMFMLLLIFLEDKGKEEQFLLSHISEFLSSNDIGESYEWTDYSTRRSLIRVLKYAVKINLIKINDGNEESFASDNNKEVLFESTGISRYIVRIFPQDIISINSKSILMEDNLVPLDGDKGVLRRNRAYRRLLLCPILYRAESPEDYEYIKNYRNIIEEDFKKYLNWNLHVHKNGAMLIPQEIERGCITFPNTSAISDIVLHITSEVYRKVRENELIRNVEDIIIIDKEEFEDIIILIKEKKGHGFSKEFREMSEGKFIYEIFKEMEKLSMMRELSDKVELLPLCGKIIGDYPKDFEGGNSDER